MNYKLKQNSVSKIVGSPKAWVIFLLGSITLLFGWDFIFLNKPALVMISKALINTILISSTVVFLSTTLAMLFSVLRGVSERRGVKFISLPLAILFNVVRSIPQVIGVLFGFIIVNSITASNTGSSYSFQIVLISLWTSLFIFTDISYLLNSRVEHYSNTEFYKSSLVSGMAEWRIIIIEIFFKNSIPNILQKVVSVFGNAIFLLCSVDFVISVGLTNDVSSINLPPTLGNMLASADSKIDILALGSVLTNPTYIFKIPFSHLQGVTVASLIVLLILSVNKISNAMIKKYKLY